MPSFQTFALLSLFLGGLAASPIMDTNEEDCSMEWVTVFADAPTGSSPSPTDSAVASTTSTPQAPPQKVVLHHSSNGSSTDTASPSKSQTSTIIVVPVAASVAAMKDSAPSDSPTATAVVDNASSAASSSSTSISPSPISASGSSLTPGATKAGISGFGGITSKTDWNKFGSKISWYSDYSPNPADSGSVKGIGLLWGDGHVDSQDAGRLTAFKTVAAAATPPEYMMGFYEPDWTPPDSSDIKPAAAATLWASLLAPLGKAGTKLGSPSLAKQKDDDWLTPFSNTPEKPTWDFTCIHTNKNSTQGVKEDVEYYKKKYGKPIWVSEFSCMNDLSWTGCDDPISYIKEVVAYFEGNEDVIAYGYSNGNGLPEEWKIFDANGKITKAGETYLAALGG